MRVWAIFVGTLAAWLPAYNAVAEPFSVTGDIAAVPGDAVIVDTRAANVCSDGAPSRNENAARCLHISQFTGPNGRLASFRDIDWVFGTVNLTGAETVLVVGDRQRDRDAVAGLLYLAGQAQVLVWAKPIDELGDGFAPAPGIAADPARLSVYRAPMRDDRLVLRGELVTALQKGGVLLLDGRRETEYWGEHIRGRRGGHIAGGQSMPLHKLRAGAALIVPQNVEPILYGHGPVDGLAYLTAVTAGKGHAARLYLGGYSEWAAHGLPVDAESFAGHRSDPKVGTSRTQSAEPPPDTRLVGISVALGALFGAIATAGAFTLGRRKKS